MMFPALFLLITAALGVTQAQNSGDQADGIPQLAEDLIGTTEDDDAFESAYEALMQTVSRPLNLNNTAVETLLSLGMLSNEQAESIVAYRSKNGNFISIYELQAVPELPLETIERIRPYIMVFDEAAALDRTLVKRVLQESDNYLLLRVSRAWSDPHASHPPYSGSPEHMLMRFRSQRPGDFSFGFNTEKDAGEPITWKASNRYYGFDRWSFHAQLQNKGVIKNLVLGDFQAQFGQGLMLGGAFGPGKGAETITTMRRANVGVVPYTSAYESGNMRGVGLSLRILRGTELTLLFSKTRRDASTDEVNNHTVASALQRSGLHRTDSELAAKQRITDIQWGCVLQRSKGALDLGITFTQTRFGLPIFPKTAPYNQYAFRGAALAQAGLYFNYNAGRFAAFGEYVKELSAGDGMIAGILGSVTRRLDVALLVRQYHPDFHPRFSNAISENSVNANERGAYAGWRYQFSRKITFTSYLDLFSFPWLRYRAYAPSLGYEWLWRLTYQPTRSILIYIQGREESKVRNEALDAPTYRQTTGTKNNYWVHAEIGLRDHVRFRTKLQCSRFRVDHVMTGGMALSQDLRIAWKRWEFVARYALFDTDNYDNRLYSYENDVLFAYAMPSYNGTGMRKMLMASVDISRHLTIWARYAETVNIIPETLSFVYTSGRYAIDREVRFQLRIKF